MRVWKVHQFDAEGETKAFNKSSNWVAYDKVEEAFDHAELETENDEDMEFVYRVERTTMDEKEFKELREFDGY